MMRMPWKLKWILLLLAGQVVTPAPPDCRATHPGSR
jgi:hypothetical protein